MILLRETIRNTPTNCIILYIESLGLRYLFDLRQSSSFSCSPQPDTLRKFAFDPRQNSKKTSQSKLFWTRTEGQVFHLFAGETEAALIDVGIRVVNWLIAYDLFADFNSNNAQIFFELILHFDSSMQPNEPSNTFFNNLLELLSENIGDVLLFLYFQSSQVFCKGQMGLNAHSLAWHNMLFNYLLKAMLFKKCGRNSQVPLLVRYLVILGRKYSKTEEYK